MENNIKRATLILISFSLNAFLYFYLYETIFAIICHFISIVIGIVLARLLIDIFEEEHGK